MHIPTTTQYRTTSQVLCGRFTTIYEISLFTLEEIQALPEQAISRLDLCPECKVKALPSAMGQTADIA